MDQEKWTVFANCTYNPTTNAWEMKARPVKRVFEPAAV